MIRHLIIMRHGKAVSWDKADDDFARPLKKRGKRQAQKIGTWLLDQGLVPDKIICSDAVRCRETAIKCIKAAGAGVSLIDSRAELYLASEKKLHKAIESALASSTNLLVVGHNPGVEALVSRLARTHSFELRNSQIMNTGTLVHFSMSQGITKPQFENHIRPEDLPDDFPYPEAGGADRRERPAYYYRQVAALPYRLTDDGLQVLAIKSSSGRYLGIPKGIHDPGVTGQQAAAKEAFEEAGVLGRMHDQPCGTFAYEKWGGQCRVTVYPLQIGNVLPVDEWPESDERERCFVPIYAIAAKAKQPGLRHILMRFAGQMRVGANS